MKKYDKNMLFVRWGNLNPRKHKEARLSDESDDRTFHTAPCFKGIYAFPQGLVESFLLGGVAPVSGKIQDRCFYLKDDCGNKIDENDFWKYDKDTNDFVIAKPYYVLLLKKRGLTKRQLSSYYDEQVNKNFVIYSTNKHTFRYNGDIWHHLSVDKRDVISERGGWTKTTFSVYIDAINRCIAKDKFASYIKRDDRHGNPHAYPYEFSKDHFEVFIERIK